MKTQRKKMHEAMLCIIAALLLAIAKILVVI